MATAKQKAWRKKFATMYGGKTKSKRSSPKKAKRKAYSRGYTMARRKKSYRRSSSGRGKMKGALIGVGSAGTALIAGVGAAALNKRFAPQFIPFQGGLAGFGIGGLMGAVGGALHDFVGNVQVGGSNTTASGGVKYY